VGQAAPGRAHLSVRQFVGRPLTRPSARALRSGVLTVFDKGDGMADGALGGVQWDVAKPPKARYFAGGYVRLKCQ